MWVVTREINEYDQDGEYFVSGYLVKPTFADLKALLKLGDAATEKLRQGGGRQGVEEEWFYLHEIKAGQRL